MNVKVEAKSAGGANPLTVTLFRWLVLAGIAAGAVFVIWASFQTWGNPAAPCGFSGCLPGNYLRGTQSSEVASFGDGKVTVALGFAILALTCSSLITHTHRGLLLGLAAFAGLAIMWIAGEVGFGRLTSARFPHSFDTTRVVWEIMVSGGLIAVLAGVEYTLGRPSGSPPHRSTEAWA